MMFQDPPRESWPQYSSREAALKKTDALLAASPDDVEIRFRRCCLLVELGRGEAARGAYLELLAKAPNHFGALINFGNLVHSQGYRKAAIALYERAVATDPDNPMGHVNLANLLSETHEDERAGKHYQEALRIDPGHAEANRGMAYLLSRMGDETNAAVYRQRAFKDRPLLAFPYCGQTEPITVLLLVSAMGGAIPMRHHFDEHIFLVTALFAEFFDPSAPLPPHQLLVNTIGDADLCQPGLQAAVAIAAKSKTPVINDPAKVMLTGRLQNTDRLSRIEGVISPKMATVSRSVLESADAPSLWGRMGFDFPLLLRPPGFHTGRYFLRVEDERSLANVLSQIPGQEILVIQYLDARQSDGKIRKYRVMMIDGISYPLHAAISHDWKIHYFTAEMADNAEHRAEDAAFLENMPRVLGPTAMKALEQICQTLGLEYCGVDFSLSAEGKIILFEANATMVVNPPEKDARWDYRRPAVQHVLDAIRRMLTKRAARACSVHL
jgi:tetratricopeptide (TPR) repeat protein